MLGIVLVGHGKLPSEFKASLKHIVGELEQLEAVDIAPEDDMEERRAHIAQNTKNVNTGDGVIILTDMFGGTPSNIAMSLLGETDNLEVIAGMNLPMLLKLVEIRPRLDFDEAVKQAQEAGKKYIHVAGHLLNTQVPNEAK